ncbi:putative F-box/LRR-repeat protein isoform X2 [Tanacetum coccineum]
MDEAKRIKVTHTSQLEAVPELIHHIQSLLPVKEAARTCVLSKSWLHALSTNPTLRFGQSVNLRNVQQRLLYINLIDRTILRYFRENIPITSFQLKMVIDDGQSYSFVNKWIRQMVSKSSITEIYLKLYIYTYEFHMSDEIFTSENLKKVSLCMYTFLHSSWKNPISPITGSMSSVRELNLNLMVIDKTFPKLLESKFPFLESLNFKFKSSSMDNLDIKYVSLARPP